MFSGRLLISYFVLKALATIYWLSSLNHPKFQYTHILNDWLIQRVLKCVHISDKTQTALFYLHLSLFFNIWTWFPLGLCQTWAIQEPFQKFEIWSSEILCIRNSRWLENFMITKFNKNTINLVHHKDLDVAVHKMSPCDKIGRITERHWGSPSLISRCLGAHCLLKSLLCFSEECSGLSKSPWISNAQDLWRS